MTGRQRMPRIAIALMLAGGGASSASAQDTFRFVSPVLLNHVFTAINAEHTGYLEAEILSSHTVDVINGDLSFGGSGVVNPRTPFRVALKGTVQTTGENGKPQKQKIVKTLRAGPGEQLTLGFRVREYTSTTYVTVTLFYYDDAGVLQGRTLPVEFSFRDDHRRNVSAMTFTRSELRRP